jgi:hypothetical protein
MQTFLPYREFARSAQVLDTPRLGKQRVETLQVLRALELGDYGWQGHPVVRMWRGRTPALVVYGLEMVRAWRDRGHADSTYELIAEFAPQVEAASQAGLAEKGLLPTWLGDGRIHLSHRSALVRKDPDFYRPVFGDVPDDLPYHWPDADELPPPPEQEGQPLWVVRAPSDGAAGAFLEGGYVAVPQPGPRSAKGRRQMQAFVEQVRVGDLVGLPLDGGSRLALGQVIGPHHEVPAGAGPDGADSDELVEHRRDVRWYGEAPRSAVRPSAHLQDPRSLFAVRLAPEALPGALPVVDVSAGAAAAPGRTAGGSPAASAAAAPGP